MAESDTDSRHDWKQTDNLTREINLGTAKNVGLYDPNYFDKLSVDGTEENRTSRINGYVRCHAKRQSSQLDSEIRFINPAIYAESAKKGDEEDEVQIRDSRDLSDGTEDRNCNGEFTDSACGDSTELSDLMSTLSIKNDLAASVVDRAGGETPAQETYRCYSLASPMTNSSLESSVLRSKSVPSSGPTLRTERRCRIENKNDRDDLYSARKPEPEVQRYILNGHRVVHDSTTSFTRSSISEHRLNGLDFARKIALDEWIRKKQQVARRKKEEEELSERKKEAEAERLAREREEKERRERESFLRWTERKKKEEEERRATIVKELELQKRLKEIEDETSIAKALCLHQWARKKKDEEKARQKRLELEKKRTEEERRKRLEESTKAFERWREMSKNKPKPATQGLLPHQKAQPAYVNPMPWQRLIDDNPDDVEENASVSRKVGTNHSKINRNKIGK